MPPIIFNVLCSLALHGKKCFVFQVYFCVKQPIEQVHYGPQYAVLYFTRRRLNGPLMLPLAALFLAMLLLALLSLATLILLACSLVLVS